MASGKSQNFERCRGLRGGNHRVALAAVGFYLEGDRLYVGVSVNLLTILLLSLIHSA